MKNNTFKRIAAGALATISVATNVMSANVGGNVFVDSIRATLVASAVDEAVKQNINFEDVTNDVISVSIDDLVYSNAHLKQLQKDGLKSVAGKTITVKSNTALKITKSVREVKFDTAAFHTLKKDSDNQDVIDKYYIAAAETDNAFTSVIIPKEETKKFYKEADHTLYTELTTDQITADADLENYKLVSSSSMVYEKYAENYADPAYEPTPKLLKEATDDELAVTLVNDRYNRTVSYDQVANGAEFDSTKQYYQKVNEGTWVYVSDISASNFDTLNDGTLYTLKYVYQQNDTGRYIEEVPTAIVTADVPDAEPPQVANIQKKVTLNDGFVIADPTSIQDDVNGRVGKVGVLLDVTEPFTMTYTYDLIAYKEFNGIVDENATKVRLDAVEDAYTKTIEDDGTYTYVFTMPDYEINLDYLMFQVEDRAALSTIAPLASANKDAETGYTAGTPMTVTSKAKELLDIVTYKYATDSNGKKLQLTDPDGNRIYKKMVGENWRFYVAKDSTTAGYGDKDLFDTFEINVDETPDANYNEKTISEVKYYAEPGDNQELVAKKLTEDEENGTINISGVKYKIDDNGEYIPVPANLIEAFERDGKGAVPVATDTKKAVEDINANYSPVYKLEAVKIKATRSNITNNKGEILQYKYTFKMPDIEDCFGLDADDNAFYGIEQKVFVQKHHHTEEWEYSTSADGTELYRQCVSDDVESCPEKGEKLLVAMLRNKVVGEGGKVTYEKLSNYTYGDGLNPVILTLVFNSDGSPTYDNGELKYFESALAKNDAFVVKNYEDTNDSLADDDENARNNYSAIEHDDTKTDYVSETFKTNIVGTYVIKNTPVKVTVGAEQKEAGLYHEDVDPKDKIELTYYFSVEPQELTIDSVSASVAENSHTIYNANKQVFEVTPREGAKFDAIEFDVKNKDGVALVADRDYIIIGKTSAEEAGEYTFTLKGINNYTGIFQVKWNLKETYADKELTADMVDIITEPRGTYARRDITVYSLDKYGRIIYSDDLALREGRDYEISGTKFATDKGTYDITIKGIGDYYGTVNLKWYVTRADITGKTAVVNGSVFNAADKKLSISTVSALREYEGVDVEEQTLIRAGLVATKDFSLAEGMDVNTNNNAVYVRGLDGADVENKVSYVFTWNKTNSTANDIWYVKPFTTFKIGSKTITVYGDLTRVQGNTSEVIVNGSAQVRASKSTVKSDTTNAGKFVLATNAYLAVPDGCTMKKAGIIASTTSEKVVNKKVSANEAQSTANDLYVRFKEGNDVAPYSRYSFTWKKTNLTENDTYYVKPFVQYTDPDGVLHTVYGDVTNMNVRAIQNLDRV
jgi:hypothetical protein